MTETLTEPVEPVEEKPKDKFPEELSSMLVQVLGDAQTICVNAGDGSLLQQFSSKNRHGIDSDEALFNRAKSKYEPCIGTYPRLSEMFNAIEASFGRTAFIIDLTVNPDETLLLLQSMSEGVGRQSLAVVTKLGDTPPLIQFRDHHQEPVIVARVNIIDLELTVTFQTFNPRSDIGDPEVMDVNVSMLNLVPIWVREQATKRALRGMEAGSSYITITDTLRMMHREYGVLYIKKTPPPPTVELYGGNMMQVNLSTFQKKVLEVKNYLRHVEQVDQKSIDFFKLHPGSWTALMDLNADGTITVEQRVIDLASVAVEEAFRVTTPISPLPVGMRLGWLTDSPRIECVLGDEERGFEAGKFYPLTASKHYTPKEFDVEEEDKKTGHMVTKTKKRNQAWTVFTIRSEAGAKSIDDRLGDDIAYLAEHFVVRDPGSMATRYPELVLPEVERIRKIEDKYLTSRGFALKTFQVGELAAIQAKGNAILAHEPGMGKTLEGLTYVLAQWDKGCQQSALIIVPADLKRQWAREAHRFYGGTIKELVHKPKKGISKEGRVEHYRAELARVRRLAKAIKAGEQKGIWIVSFRDLAQFTSHLNVKEKAFVVKVTKENDEWVPGHWLDGVDEEGKPTRTYIEGFYKQKEVEHFSTSCCPRCHGSWDGVFCKRTQIQAGATYPVEGNSPKWHKSKNVCGYSVFDIKVKTVSSIISTAFAAGVVIVDEGTSIANESQQTDSVSAIRGKARLLMSGTPIKNRIGQAFNLLRWCLGPKSERFPYSYGNKTEFTGTYGVFESTMSSEGKWGPPKPVGDTTNRTEMWKQLACAISRLTKDESGVRIPPKKQHVIENPLGVKQREQLDSWRRNFPAWYAETHPDDPKVLSGYYLNNFLRLGIEAKFNWACVMPTGDRAHEWTKVHPSDYTPMAYKTLETVMNLVALKRKVILGSDTPLAVEWLAARLREKGVRVACTCKDGASIAQDERVLEIEKFQEGDVDVLAASIRSINLGHNIDKATAVVLHGLDWDYATNVQFQDRANRLSSVAPCDIFAILPGAQNGTIIGRKWATLQDKGAGISVALQGSADEIDQQDVNKEAILREMIDKGFPVQGNEVDEATVRNAWDRLPNVFVHKTPEKFSEQLCTWDEDAEPELVPKMYLTPMITVGQVNTAIESFFRSIRYAEVRKNQEAEDARIEQERQEAAEWAAMRAAVSASMREIFADLKENYYPKPVEVVAAPAENDMVAYLREQNQKLLAQVDALTGQVAALTAAIGNLSAAKNETA